MASTWIPTDEEVWDAIRYLDPDTADTTYKPDPAEATDEDHRAEESHLLHVLGLAYVRQHLRLHARSFCGTHAS